MPDQHPSRSKLELFMRGELTAADCRELVLHLLSGCDECREVARQSFPCESAGQVEESNRTGQRSSRSTTGYRGIFEQVLPKIWESEVTAIDERASAPALFEELQRHPHERRLLMVRNSRKFRSIALCELVLDEALRLGVRNPNASVELGRLGVAISEWLSAELYSSQLISDLQGRARSVLGNALRVSGELDAAATEIRIAEKLLQQGTGDKLEHGRLLEFKARLMGERREFQQSLGLLNEAIRIYRRFGEYHRLGRALISKGFELGEKGDITGAITSLRQGLKHISGSAEPRLVLVAKHNLLHHLYDLGRYHQALALVPEIRALHERFGNEMDLMRFEWLKARIYRESGDLDSAHEALRGVRDFFIERGVVHDVALVSLDLAMIYLRRGQSAELARLASEMLTIFNSLRIHREAIAALVLFQRAIELDRVTFGLVRDLAAYLKNSRQDPHIPFRPSLIPHE